MKSDARITDSYLDSNLYSSLEELKQLCSIPSVSAKGENLFECASLVGDLLKNRGFMVELISTSGPPVVIAERKGLSDNTLLFYNHYDVQPAEPYDLWESPPFEGTVRDGKFFARGADDDKGHITNRLFAIDALLADQGELPCNIKFCIEGDEEASGLLIHEFLAQHHNKLTADACIWEFGGVDHRDLPIQYLGLRGVCCVELKVRTAKRDAHSGLGGSIFPNAAWRLVWALASIKDKEEKIAINGFFEKIIELNEKDMELYSAMPDPTNIYLNEYGLEKFINNIDGGFALNFGESALPSCTINGLTAGYQGKGSKTVLPAFASAKLDFRLVPDQRPEDILHQLRAHLDQNGFLDVEMEYQGGEAPASTNPDNPFIQLVSRTAEDVYGAPSLLVPMCGGSGPNHVFIKWLNVPIATVGMNYPGTQEHSPNENIRIDLYLKAAKHTTRILKAFGEMH